MLPAVSPMPTAPTLPLAADDPRRTRCEIWTRVMGYYRPKSAFNVGKQGEYDERVCFKEPTN